MSIHALVFIIAIIFPLVAYADHVANEKVWGHAHIISEHDADAAEEGYIQLANGSKLCWEKDPPGAPENCIWVDSEEHFVFEYDHHDGSTHIDILNADPNEVGHLTETAGLWFLFGGMNAAAINVIKENDFVVLDDHDAAIAFYTMSDGTMQENARLDSLGNFDVKSGFTVDGNPIAGTPDFSVPWTWANDVDTWWTPIKLKSGLTSTQSAYIAWQDYLGTDKWYLGNTSSNFQLYDLNQGYPRIFLSSFTNQWMASDSHLFQGAAGANRFTVLGDADTVCIGPNEDTCLTRASAGIIDFTQVQHTHLDDVNAGLLTFDAIDELLPPSKITQPLDNTHFLGSFGFVPTWRAITQNDLDLSMPWTWNNNIDAAYMPIILRGGATADQRTEIGWKSNFGVTQWGIGKTAVNEFAILDYAAADRILFDSAGDSNYRTGTASADHLFRSRDNDIKFQILGDADTICIGPLEDTCFTRLGAGSLDFTQAQHTHLDAANAGLLTNQNVAWTWDNDDDSTFIPIRLRGGSTANQTVSLAFEDYQGVDIWSLRKNSANAYQVRDIAASVNRINLTAGGSNAYQTAGGTNHHDFRGADGTTRAHILGDADSICLGASEDTCLTRTDVGIVDAHGILEKIITTDDSGPTTLTGAQVSGAFHVCDHSVPANDCDYSLPSAATGYNACWYENGGGTGAMIIDAASGDEILLDGFTVGVGDSIVSDGTNGDLICLVAISNSVWVTRHRDGNFSDGGA